MLGGPRAAVLAVTIAKAQVWPEMVEAARGRGNRGLVGDCKRGTAEETYSGPTESAPWRRGTEVDEIRPEKLKAEVSSLWIGITGHVFSYAKNNTRLFGFANVYSVIWLRNCRVS